MAKKKKQSLAERIAALINWVGEKPEPTFGDIKSELVECLGLSETLENGALIRDAENKVTVLEAALEKSNLENSNLQAELQSLKTEVDGFRAERKKQEEKTQRKYPDLPPLEEAILWMLIGEDEGVNERFVHSELERQHVKISLEKVKLILEKKLEGFAFYNPEDGTYGQGTTWFATDAAREYFDERDKL